MSFFDKDKNPFLKIFEGLDPEVQEDYKQKGRNLYEYINFETGDLYDTPPTPLDRDAIERCLQSGMSVADLTEEERMILGEKIINSSCNK